jgi:glycine cleavage system aminomethyltransferase T
MTEKIATSKFTEEQPGKSDVGLTALTGAISHLSVNGPEAKKVLRKIDLHLLPFLCVTYLIQV